MSLITIHNKTRNTRIANQVVLADTQLTRIFGLLGRKHLDPEEGLWIKPSTGVHTIGMSFPIDVVGLNKEHQVVKLWNCLVPYRFTSISWKVRSIIELPAGSIQRHGLELGDRFVLTESEFAMTSDELRHPAALLNSHNL